MANPDPAFNHGVLDYDNPTFVTRDPQRAIDVTVVPGEPLGDLTRRVFGINTEVGRQRILDATGGNYPTGQIRIPK